MIRRKDAVPHHRCGERCSEPGGNGVSVSVRVANRLIDNIHQVAYLIDMGNNFFPFSA